MSANKFVYSLQNLGKTYPGGKQVLRDITLYFLPGAKIGVLGLNGSGKSSLLRIMAGLDKDFSGEAWSADGLKVGYLPQEPQLDPDLSVIDNVMMGLKDIKAVVDQFNELSMKFAEVTDDDEMSGLIDQQAQLQEIIDAADAWDLERHVLRAMDALRCPAGDADVATLSGGERRRVALARLLLEKPDMLLLDEPTNHLDAESVAWLQRFLSEYAGTVVMVTHDRYFLDNVTSWILELDRGQGIPLEGNYSHWLEQKQKRLQQEGREQVARLRTLASEREWVNASARARQTKSKARISSYENLLQQAQDTKPDSMQIYIPPGPRLGSSVITMENVSKTFDGKMLIEDFSCIIPPGAVLGMIGANGVGKTTMMRMITGQDKPDQGTIGIGETVKMSYVDQSRDALKDTATVWEEISDGSDIIELGKHQVQSRAYVGGFNFKGSDQQKPVGKLSGGERNRVHLAKILKEGANVLLLDEPTNDLDVDTLRALEEAIDSFAGVVIVISHDRWFLDRITTHILAFRGESQLDFFEGDYSAYEQDCIARHGKAALEPTRIKYKRIA